MNTESEIVLFQARYITTRQQAAKRLRILANAIEARHFRMGGHPVEIPEEVRLKVECHTHESRAAGEFEVEIHWRPGESSQSEG